MIARLVLNLDEEAEKPFMHDGFNGLIPMHGAKRLFYECHYCANATESAPGYCSKCYGSSFISVKIPLRVYKKASSL